MSDLSNHTELRELPVRSKITTDVAVIGGGTAGVFAAISAARTGAKTVLVEKNSMLGGTLTVAGVNFPGLFYAWQKQIGRWSLLGRDFGMCKTRRRKAAGAFVS